MRGLTQTQARTLRYLSENNALTLQDICHAFGWASTTSARCVLLALEKKGFVRLTKGKHRGVEVLKPVPEGMTP